MDFSFTKEQLLIQKTAKEFADTVLQPAHDEIERTNDVPKEIIEQMGEYELGGIPYDPEIGGAGADYVSYALALEQIAYASSGAASVISSNNVAMNCINKFGTDEQRKRYMGPCMSLKEISSFAFTEPATGSDPKSIEATAKLDGDEWVLNGTKRFISSANYPGPMVVFAKDDQSGYPTAFIVDKFCEGYSLSERWDKVGFHGSYLYDVYMKGIRIPKSNLLGEVGKGYKVLQANIAFSKLSIAASATGRAQAALDCAIDYAKNKTRRGAPISNYGSMQHRIADMYVRVEAIRAMMLRLAWIADTWTDDGEIARESAATKIFTVNECAKVCEDALQCMGSYGTMREYKVESFVRDSLIGEIVEGSDDVQHAIVASRLGLKTTK